VLNSIDEASLNEFRATYKKLTKASEVREMLLKSIQMNIK
jgi:hypothetical protein